MSDFEISLNNGQMYHSVQVEKNTRGYNWTVKIAGFDKEKILQEVKNIEKELKEEYGN